jgi:hypothetical protein
MDTITVYWTPVVNTPGSWNLLYREPTLVLDDLLAIRNKEKQGSFFACPATSAIFNNLYVVKSNIEDKFDFPEGFLEALPDKDVRTPLQQIDSKVGLHRNRESSFRGYKNIEYNMGWAFFADEPLLAKFTAPYMPTHSPTTGSILASGEFDIGQWMRPWHLDYFIPNEAGGMEFNVDDPLFYVEFKTDKRIEFKRFNRTTKIDEMMIEAVQSPSRYGFRKTLSQRYEMAKKANIRNLILSEIKNNLVD